MPTRPQRVTMDTNVMNILNAIRNNASNEYKDYVPPMTDTSQLREIGTIIMDYPSLQNEFLSALINRIGRVLISTKMYENPWTRFKKGMLDYGETVEEIFTNIAKPYEFEGSHTSPTSQFKKYKPDVRSAFHVMNYRKYYPVTIEQQKLRQAFLSAEGVTNLIGDIVNSLYTGANYDEWLTMKYLLAKTILKGRMYPVETKAISADNAKDIVTTVKENSNILEFPSTKYNPAHVFQHTKKSEQVIFINARFDAIMDVNVLASAFNMDKAQFMGQRVLIDSFGSLDRERLNELFADDPNYVPITDEEVEALDTIPMAVVDEKFFMIFDNLNEFTEIYNAELLYWNYFYHQWKTFSTSPFSNALVYVPTTPSVTGITVTPATASVSAGSSLALTVKVETDGFAPQTVVYESDTDGVTITEGGVVQVDEGVSGTATITVTSTYDETVSATVTLTIS